MTTKQIKNYKLGDYLVFTYASITAAVGALIMLGWHLHWPGLIRLHYNFPETVYNTALGLVMGGVALIAIMKGKTIIPLILGILCFLLGIISVIQFDFQLDFGIDQLIMTDYMNPTLPNPGRTSYYTALCFIASGIAFILIPILPKSPKKQITIRLLGTIILAIANVTLFGSFFGRDVSFIQFSQTEPHLTPVLQLYSLAIISYAWMHCAERLSKGLPKFLPIPATFGVILGTIFLWQAFKSHELAQIYDIEVTKANDISFDLEENIDHNIDAIHRLTQRWEAQGGTPKLLWETDAQMYLKDLTGVRSIHWIDSNYQTQWSVPQKNVTYPIKPFRLEIEDLQELTMEHAKNLKTIMMTKVLKSGYDEDQLFIVYSPIEYEQTFDGWIVAVFDLENLIKQTIPKTVLSEYRITISDDDGRFIYNNNLQSKSVKNQKEAQIPFDFIGLKWVIHLSSTPETYENNLSILPTFNLCAGIILSLFIGLSVYFAQKTHFRSQDLEKALNDLQESKTQTEVVLHSIGEGILGLDVEGRTLFINPSGAHMFGYQPSDFDGRSFIASATTKPYDTWFSRNITPIVNKVQKEKSEYVAEGVFWKKNGSHFPVEFSASPISDRDMNYGTVIVFRDITDRKKAEAQIRETQQRFKSIIDNADAIISVKDLSGRYMIINRKFIDTFHLNEESEVIGKNDYRFFPNEIADKLSQNDAEVIRTKKAITFEEVIPQDDGDHTYISVKVPLYDSEDKLYGISCIATDITARKRTELQLKNYLNQIEKANKELGEARRTAEQANIAKSAFLANMSHELRTPLNGVIGTTSLLQNMELDEKQKKYVNLINLSGNLLLDLINDILDFSKIEAGKLKLENIPCKIRDIIDETVNILNQRAKDKGLELKQSVNEKVPESIIGDPMRIRQVLNNLISNSIKFTETGQVIVNVKCESFSDQESTITFEVKDTGIGISKEVLPQLFQKFTQADVSTTRKFGGTGLGLAISKQLVELMGGEIGVDSVKGEGSTFWFKVVFPIPTPETQEKT